MHRYLFLLAQRILSNCLVAMMTFKLETIEQALAQKHTIFHWNKDLAIKDNILSNFIIHVCYQAWTKVVAATCCVSFFGLLSGKTLKWLFVQSIQKKYSIQPQSRKIKEWSFAKKLPVLFSCSWYVVQNQNLHKTTNEFSTKIVFVHYAFECRNITIIMERSLSSSHDHT